MWLGSERVNVASPDPDNGDDTRRRKRVADLRPDALVIDRLRLLSSGIWFPLLPVKEPSDFAIAFHAVGLTVHRRWIRGSFRDEPDWSILDY